MTLHVDSDRAGGLYRIGLNTAHSLLLTTDIDMSMRARLTTMLVDQRSVGEPRPLVTQELIKQAQNKHSLSVYERADRLLKYLAEQKIMGRYLYRIPEGSLAWSESMAMDEQAVILEYLIKNNRVDRDICYDESNPDVSEHCYRVTLEGYHHLEVYSNAADPAQAFVAMWFDEEMNNARDNGIIPAIKGAGYRPFIVNTAHFEEEITDKIISEIRRSRFVIADFTHKKKGTVRGSVYFEAGFAYGLGKPVIYTCREKSKLAFDTNHYPHIEWKEDKLDELREQLKDRIVAVVDQGPLPIAE